jgi:hypothetical protein
MPRDVFERLVNSEKDKFPDLFRRMEEQKAKRKRKAKRS